MRLSKIVGYVMEGYIKGEEKSWEREIDGLLTDSRKKLPSSLFFCLKGGQTDSHELAAEAVKNGAVAVVAERETAVSVPQFIVPDAREALGRIASFFYGEPSKEMKVIAVTGTNGKTTTSYMLEAILKAAGKKVGVIGTLGARFGERKRALELTTPDPIELQSILAEMKNEGVEYAVMEASAHALYYKKTAGIRFSACIFTNLSQDHLDFFANMKAYKKAKLRLFESAVCPLAIVNGDDEVGREIGRLREKEGGKTVFYGLNTPTDAFAIVTDESLKGTECMLNVNDKLCRASLSMTGRHNVYNALAAGACAIELGIEVGVVAKGLKELKSVRGRLERVGSFHGAELYVDFAHTPDGLEKSLEALRAHCKGRLICLFGCGGNRDKEKRPLMGEIAAKKSDFSVLTSDNPRYEDPLDIISDIEKGYRRYSCRYVVVPDRKRAVDYALEFLSVGDVLLVAGKGGEETQEIMGIKYPFDDQAVIGRLLEEKQTEY